LADFIKRLRLDKSLAMMSQHKRPALTKIALQCGFSSSSDFSRSFKQRFGAAPSAFDLAGWRDSHRAEFEAMVFGSAERLHLRQLADGGNGAPFQVKIRQLPARTVAYVRVSDPYQPNAVFDATARLLDWAQRRRLADGQWLGYQWENPELVKPEHCRYHIAVEAERFTPHGEVGRFHFPAMTVAQVEIRGGIELELRVLQWLYGTWLPRSRYVPDDHPAFEAFIGKPFAHGTEHFELHAQLPVRFPLDTGTSQLMGR
jgi:AraC family transcriptional regulator